MCRERAVVVEVVGLDVGQDRPVQRQLEVGAVALVGLDDEPLAARPVGAGAGVGDVAADDEARRQPASASGEHQHRRRRRLAVGAGDGERPGPGADRRQHPRPPQRRDALLAGLVELDVRGRDRGRRGDGVAAVHDGGGRGRRGPSTPAARTRSSAGCVRRSLPDTSWPISASAMAIALMPGPPTPTTCSRSGVDRSSGPAARRRGRGEHGDTTVEG